MLPSRAITSTGGRDHVEIEVVTSTSSTEAVERVDVGLQPNACRLGTDVRAHARAEFGIVQQQVGELASLLHQVR